MAGAYAMDLDDLHGEPGEDEGEEDGDFIDGEDFDSDEDLAPLEAVAGPRATAEYNPDAATIAANKEQIQAVEQSLTHGQVRAKRASSTTGQGYMLRYILHGPKQSVRASTRESRKFSLRMPPTDAAKMAIRPGGSLETLPLRSSPLAPRRSTAVSAPPLSEIRVRSNDKLVPLQEALLASMAQKHADEVAFARHQGAKDPRIGNIEIGRHNTIVRRTGAIKAVEKDLRRPSADSAIMRGTARHRESIAEIEWILKQEGKSDPDTGEPSAERVRSASSAPSPSTHRASMPRMAIGDLVRDTRNLLLQQVQATSESDHVDQRTQDAIHRYFELFCEPGEDTIAAEDVRRHMLAYMPTPFSQEELMILWGKDLPRDRLSLEAFTELCLLHGLESIPALAESTTSTLASRGATTRRKEPSATHLSLTRTFSERELLVDPVQSSV